MFDVDLSVFHVFQYYMSSISTSCWLNRQQVVRLSAE
jgi:hypothetical protein